MRQGFIFSYEMCVGCKACSAACMLENGWTFKSREIYTANRECFRPDPVINLSMACNHCGDPACLQGCPSGAYSRDLDTGAVIIDPEKCIGCRYCIWNCPYGAPKFNEHQGIIEKCHYCYHRLGEGVEPACSSSCPTGALGFGEIPDLISHEKYRWMPEKGIDPSLLILGSENYSGPVNIPEKEESKTITGKAPEAESTEWSLLLFTYLTACSVALSSSSFFLEGTVAGKAGLMLIISAAVFSLFHLGSYQKAWRAVINFRRSPLSREIVMVMVYGTLLSINQFLELPFAQIVIPLAGLSLVILIDSVYNFAYGRSRRYLHSGNLILTVMIMISFLLNLVVPFVFIAFIKGGLSLWRMWKSEKDLLFPLRFFRFAFLLITVFVMIKGAGDSYLTTYLLFFSGELADRLLYYADFTPLNIKDTLIFANRNI